MKLVFAQGFGILALIVNIICYQLNSQKKILIAQIVASVMFILNLVLLDAMSGALLNIHGILRALIYAQKGKHRWADSPWWVVGLIALAGGIIALTYHSPLDLLPLVGTVFTTIALSMTDAAKIRLLTLPSPPCWFVYHLTNGNIGGTLNEIFVLGSIVVGMIRLDRPKAKRT